MESLEWFRAPVRNDRAGGHARLGRRVEARWTSRPDTRLSGSRRLYPGRGFLSRLHSTALEPRESLVEKRFRRTAATSEGCPPSDGPGLCDVLDFQKSPLSRSLVTISN